VNLVVTVNWRKRLGEKSNWVPFFIFSEDLKQDSTSGEVRTVCFNTEGLGEVR